MKYIYKDNNSDKLIIVFSGNIMTPGLDTEQLRSKVSWPNLPNEQTEFNVLYILDSYGDLYGWNTLDYGNLIVDELKRELADFIKKHKFKKQNVYTMGSSKGGYASLLYGLQMEEVGTVISLIPIMNPENYIDFNSVSYDERNYEMAKNKDKFEDILYSINIDKESNVFMYTGFNDHGYSKQVTYAKYLNKSLKKPVNMCVLMGPETHNAIVVRLKNDVKFQLNSIFNTGEYASKPGYAVYKLDAGIKHTSFGAIKTSLEKAIKGKSNCFVKVRLPIELQFVNVAIYVRYKDGQIDRFFYDYYDRVLQVYKMKIRNSEDIESFMVYFKDRDYAKSFDIEL